MSDKFGYCIEKYPQRYLVSPATLEKSVIKCHDLSGFNGSWPAKPDSLFIFNGEDKVFDEEKEQLANQYARILNNLTRTQLIADKVTLVMGDFFKKGSYFYLIDQKDFILKFLRGYS